MSKPLERQIVERARDLTSKGWTQHVVAVDKLGKFVCPTTDDAKQFCLVGAVIRAAWETTGSCYHPAEVNVIVGLARSIGDGRTRDYYSWPASAKYASAEGLEPFMRRLLAFNDKKSRTCSDVLNLFDRFLKRYGASCRVPG
jgi:hypothetical protein